MRLAFVSVSDQMGGSEVVLLEIVRGLRRSRPSWRAHVIVPGGGPLARAVEGAGTSVTVLPMPASLAQFGETAAVSGLSAALPMRLLRTAMDVPAYQRQLNATFEAIAPDVVHTNGFKAHVVAARSHARPLVWHVHEYVSRRPMTTRLMRRYARQCDAIVANSESVAADIRSVVGGSDVRTIANGVDVTRFSPDGARADLDALCGLSAAPAGTIRVGLVATFGRWKGHRVFLDALGSIARELPIRGYIVGAPVYDTRGSQYTLDELQATARATEAADRVGFTGFVEDPADVLRALDIVIHASTDPEPFGMVIAEAMACGRAVVTSATGGAAELVRHDVDAIVHPPGDAAALARAIVGLASDGAARGRLGRAARIAAVERFDAGRMTSQFAMLYEEMARRRGVRR